MTDFIGFNITSDVSVLWFAILHGFLIQYQESQNDPLLNVQQKQDVINNKKIHSKFEMLQ